MWKSVYFLAVCLQVFIWGALPTYIVGGQDNKATLWITDTSGSEPRTILLGENNEKYSEAFSLTAVGSKLFCVGRQQDDETDAKATLWIVDTKDLQPRAVTLVKSTVGFSAAYSIAAIGNQLFCVGQAQNQENYVEKATLWITDILGSAPIAVNLGEITAPNSNAHSITAIGNKLYCAGEQKFSGSPFYRAILWITDLAGSSLNSITLADDGASSIASSITSAFQQIYCAGMQSNNGHDSATIWIRDLSGSLVKTATFQEPSFNSTAYCIAASSNQLFLGGQREINGTNEKIASLWITDASASTEAVFTLGEKNNEASQVNSIDSAEHKIFSVGQQGPYDTALAMLWVTNSFGGELTSIPIGIPGSWANGIYIKKPVTSSINFYNAIHRFSPSQFQRGF